MPASLGEAEQGGLSWADLPAVLAACTQEARLGGSHHGLGYATARNDQHEYEDRSSGDRPQKLQTAWGT
jgi:hypothetical protein